MRRFEVTYPEFIEADGSFNDFMITVENLICSLYDTVDPVIDWYMPMDETFEGENKVFVEEYINNKQTERFFEIPVHGLLLLVKERGWID